MLETWQWGLVVVVVGLIAFFIWNKKRSAGS
jgi:hypothetical protein